MAVINDYVISNVANKLTAEGHEAGGKPGRTLLITFEVAAGDDDGSKYRLASMSGHARLKKVEIANDALTSGTDWDLGTYKTLAAGGAVIDKDILLDGGDLSSARLPGAGLNGLSAVNQADWGKKLYELAGQTEASHDDNVDLVLTANTVGSAAGTVTVLIEFM